MEKSTEKVKFWTDRKKTITRVVLALIFLGVAIFFILRGCTGFLNKGTGYQTINVNAIETDQNEDGVYPFFNEISFSYYFTVTGPNQNTQKQELEQDYNAAVSTIFRYLDSERTYLNGTISVKNIAYINAHPNEEIVIDETLYNILKSAYQHMNDSNGEYNIYAGQLETFWRDLIEKQELGAEMSVLDPFSSTTYASKLDNIVQNINDYRNDTTQGLVFNDSNKSVKFIVQSGFTNKVVIDLQTLEHAYALEYIYSAMKDKWDGGYLTSKFGYAISLGKCQESSEGLWQQVYSTPTNRKITFNGGTQVRTAYVSDYSYYYYTLIDEYGVSHPRHLFYSALTGYQKNTVRGVAIYNLTNTSLDEVALNAMLEFSNSLNDIKTAIKNNDLTKNYYFALYETSDDIYSIYVQKGVNGLAIEEPTRLEELE